MFQSHRLALAMIAAAALMVSTTQAAHAATVFDLQGAGGAQPSFTFTEDGITLTVTASGVDAGGQPLPANPDQSGAGVGVLDDPDVTYTLDLEFSRDVTLNAAIFSDVGDGHGTDAVDFTDGEANGLGSVAFSSNVFGVDVVDFNDAGLTLTGQSFGITPNNHDGYRLSQLAATPNAVPTPAAAGAGFALLGLLGMRRRHMRTV